jgi:protein dithiol oxidoreductase (disulfide-forming)
MRNLFGSLLLALSLVAGFAHALAAAPVAGTNYEVLKVAQPTSAPPGKVEVIEFFSYAIPQCYTLERAIEAFVKKEGDRILLKRVPVAFHPTLSPYSQLYYSLVSLGLEEKLMLTVYNEVFHGNGKYNLLFEQDQADFLATQGVDKRKFIEAHESDNVISLMEQGDDLSVGYQSDVLPTLVVAGRYKIVPVNNGPDGMTTVLEYLVKQVQDKKL